jgi:hypothetical protein
VCVARRRSEEEDGCLRRKLCFGVVAFWFFGGQPFPRQPSPRQPSARQPSSRFLSPTTTQRGTRAAALRDAAPVSRMAPTTRRASRAAANWAANCVFALPELWVIIAEHSGLVGVWRLTGVCRASREGAKLWMRTLPGLVVCGGLTTGVGGGGSGNERGVEAGSRGASVGTYA